MSYKDKKIKRSQINQLKYKLGLALNKFFYNIILKKKEKQKMRQIQNVLKFLREKSRLVKSNNLKINEWVDRYLTDCFVNGRTVNILTQWCLSSMLKKRFKEQGDKFVPTKKERRILQEEIPTILSLFSQNGFSVNWWITFNPTFVESDGIPKDEYKKMLTLLADDILKEKGVIFVDWEDDVLGKKPEPDVAVLKNFSDYISQNYINLRVGQLKVWAEKEADWTKTDQQLEEEIKYATACEANEAKLLTFENPMFGNEDFILIPLDDAETYDSFESFVPGFKKRLVTVLSLTPWRMKS